MRRRDSAGSKSTPTSKPPPSTGAPRSRRPSRTAPQTESHAPKSVQTAGVVHIPPKVSSRESGSKAAKANIVPPREKKVSMSGRDADPPATTPRKLQKRPPNVVLQDNHSHNVLPLTATAMVSPPTIGEPRPSMPPKRPSSPRNSSAVGSPHHVSEAPSAMRSPGTPANFNYTSYFELKSSPKAPSTSPSATRRLSSGAPGYSPSAMNPTSKLQAQYDSQYRTSASPNSPTRGSSNGMISNPQDAPSYVRSRRGSQDQSPIPIPQQMPGYPSSGSSRHTVSSTHSSQQQAQISPKAAPSRAYDAQLDDAYSRKHQQRASSMPVPQNTDFYPSLDASMSSPPLADRTHGRRATVDNGYSHERAQTMPSHRSHLGPVPLVDSGQGRFSYHLQTSYPQAIPGLNSHIRPLNAASPSAATGVVFENRTSPSMTQASPMPQTHRGSTDIGSQKTMRKSKEIDCSPSQFDPSVNVLNRPSPQQQVQPQRRVSIDKSSPYPIVVEAMPSPPIVIYRGSPYTQPSPEHHMSPAPPVSVAFPDSRQPYAPISLSKPSPNSSRRSSLMAVGPESLSDSFNSRLEFRDQEQSRPISRLSNVSDPVIPDPSLLVEAAVLRGREKPFRPRLYDYASSESPPGSDEESEDDDEDEDSDEDDDRPARPRSRGSVRSVRSSRSAGDPGPSILKRSGSRCSQRSSKSVRLDIPEDQAAVQEVRRLQDEVYEAGTSLFHYLFASLTLDVSGMKVEEARRRWDRGEVGAELAFKDAQHTLRDMYARLREKEESFRKFRKYD